MFQKDLVAGTEKAGLMWVRAGAGKPVRKLLQCTRQATGRAGRRQSAVDRGAGPDLGTLTG